MEHFKIVFSDNFLLKMPFGVESDILFRHVSTACEGLGDIYRLLTFWLIFNRILVHRGARRHVKLLDSFSDGAVFAYLQLRFDLAIFPFLDRVPIILFPLHFYLE